MNVEPSVEVTGGVLAEDVFDPGFFEQIGRRVVEFVRAQGRADRQQVGVFVRGVSGGQIELSEEDVFRILESQVYDGKIEAVDGEGMDVERGEGGTTMLPNKSYRAVNWYTPRMILPEVPCAF